MEHESSNPTAPANTSLITYLELREAPPPVIHLPAGVVVERLAQPSVETYRALYNGVGRDYQWHDRNRLTDDELLTRICHPHVTIHCLRVMGRLAGYSELKADLPAEVELVYFGLFPEFIGRGLGKRFLDWTLTRAWQMGPERIWLHTCDRDHPAALPNYLRAGFRRYKQVRAAVPPISSPPHRL